MIINHPLLGPRDMSEFIYYGDASLLKRPKWDDKNAEDKLNKKNCDWIISNDVSNSKIGFNSDYNEVKIH